MNNLVVEGFTINWEKYEELKKKWKTTNKNTTLCQIHNTYFNPEGEDGEPCWECWDSCQVEVKNE